MIQDNVEIIKSYYPSGALWGETPCVNGRVHGIAKQYYPSGTLCWEATYVNGHLHGVVKTYCSTGALLTEAPYVEGKKHGIKKSYGKDNINIVCLKLYKINREVLTLCCEI